MDTSKNSPHHPSPNHISGRQADNAKIHAVVAAALPDVPFDGWTPTLLTRAAQKTGLSPAETKRLFPRGVADLIAGFSSWADAAMLKVLEKKDLQTMRVRDRITLGVQTRLDVLQPHRQALSSALGYMGVPPRSFRLPKLVWTTADAIWWAAGDTATDYNHYSKRALLSGVLSATTLFWLSDESKNYADTAAFLDRRIENVMTIGKRIGQAKSMVKGKFSRENSAA